MKTAIGRPQDRVEKPRDAASSASVIFGTFPIRRALTSNVRMEEDTMDGLIYLVGLIVIIMFILSLFGLR